MSASGASLPPPSSFPGNEATIATPARRQDQDVRQHAWQREMEKAALEAWFRRAPQGAATPPTAVPAALPLFGSVAVPQAAAGSAASPSSADASSSESPADRSPPPSTDESSPADTQRAAAASDVSPRSQRALSGWASAAELARQGRDALAPAEDPIAVAGTLAASSPAGDALAPTVPMPNVADRVAPTDSLSARGPAPLDAGAANLLASSSPAPADGARLASAERLGAAVARALEPAAPVRMHVEWSADAATVWIGLDRSAALELPRLVDRLSRWMSRIGVRLRSVVCNGTACFTPRDDGVARPPATNVDIVVDKEI